MQCPLVVPVCLYAAFAGGLAAQAPLLLRDINPAVDERPSSAPRRFTAIGEDAWFSAENPLTGREPYITGGTSATTRLLADVERGPASSFPGTFTAFGGAVFFAATTAAHGRELHRSDGTAAGTAVFADLVPGAGSSSPNQMLAVGDTLYILAGGPEEGDRAGANVVRPENRGAFYQLWKSDGTAQGTVLVEDIHHGGAAWARSETVERQDMVAVGSTLFSSPRTRTAPSCGRATGRRRAPSW